MPATLTVTGLDVSFGARVLVSGLDLTLADGDVTALVGPNGSGKSTLMRMLVGDLPVGTRLGPAGPTRRHVRVAAAGAALPTTSRCSTTHDGAPASPRPTARSSGEPRRWRRDGPGERRTTPAPSSAGSALGAADLVDRLPEVAARVGLRVDPGRPLGSLSGGEAARATLVAVLLSQYDLLLLDEPTNDLDERGRALMVEFVRAHPGPVLVASHDRGFLDEVATGVVELDLHQARVGHYAGGWSDYVAARELARGQAREAYAAYATARDTLAGQARQRQEWAAKGHRAVRAGMEADKHLRERDRARADKQLHKAARVTRAIDRLDVVEQPRKEWQLRYAITEGPPSSAVVASLDGAVVERGGFRLGPVSLGLGRGDRVAVTGDNGSGKSTLVGALLGDLPLAAGRRTDGSRVSLGVVDQQRSLLDTDRSVLEVVGGELGAEDGAEVRTLLAKFGLGAEHVHRPARSLSLGERTRALLALFQGQEVNVLVLDEPTNHLDVAAVEQLESAVAGFGGTIVVVSHDRVFLDVVGITHEWRLESGRLTVTDRR